MNTEVTHSLPPFSDLRLHEFDMYLHLPYKKDIYLCTPETIKLISGNVVKYYTIQPLDEITIDTNDLAEHLVELGKEESRRFHSHIIARPEDVIDYEDTAASVLPGDPAEPLTDAGSPESSSAPAPKPVLTSSFAEVSENDYDFSFLNRK